MQGEHRHLRWEHKQLGLRLHTKGGGWSTSRDIACSVPMVGLQPATADIWTPNHSGRNLAPVRRVSMSVRILFGLARGETLTAMGSDSPQDTRDHRRLRIGPKFGIRKEKDVTEQGRFSRSGLARDHAHARSRRIGT